MNAFVRNERAKRMQLNRLAVAYAAAHRRCTDPYARSMGGALRDAVSRLWNAGGAENVAASLRAAQLAVLAVRPVKLSGGTNAYLQAMRAAANGAIGHELDEECDPRAADIELLDALADVFWFRGDEKHGRAAVAVLCIIERLLAVGV